MDKVLLTGVVVIGRNEGKRLHLCLKSVKQFTDRIVYVDSGSTDDSVDFVLDMGVIIEHLDMTQPFTAARARNRGFQRLIQEYPNLDFVQFVDGDCEIVQDWFSIATAFLGTHPEVAVVCGRRRERFPQLSVYNRLCDIEWNTPIGEAKACGGDALMRADVLKAVNGYRETLIAGEEPELCVRIRQAGYKIWRLDVEMTLHDAAMYRFRQWWKRTARGGYAFAEGAALHGATPERHWVAESRRAMLWGLGLPVLFLLALLIYPMMAYVIILIYLLQFLRLLRSHYALMGRNTLIYVVFLMIGKFAEAYGQLVYYKRKLFRHTSQLIEYK